jgi:glycosyltransferase involved in cell wall biosynthesis
LEGYDYQFVKNTSKDQGTHHFRGMINPELNLQIEKWEADAVLIFGWNFQSHFKAMRYFKGKIPVLFRGDSTLLDEKPGFKTFFRWMVLKFVYQFIDYAFYVGSNNRKYFTKHGLEERQLIFAPHVIDNERFNIKKGSLEIDAGKWRNELKIDQGNLVFLFAGKFEPKKDPEILVQAAKKVSGSNYTFIFAGDGQLKDKLLKISGNISNVVFIPFQNQSKMPLLYGLCDVFVLPSSGPYETWGLAINEAMACGKALLASDKVGCAIDLVQNGINGYIFRAGDLDDLVAKIQVFDRKTCADFGRQSSSMIKKYSIENLVLSIESLINNTKC